MANQHNTVLYIGVTKHIEQRIWQHENTANEGSFSDKYNCHKLVYVEQCNSIKDAIAREKQLKNWKREWKDALIEKLNPNWLDMSIYEV